MKLSNSRAALEKMNIMNTVSQIVFQISTITWACSSILHFLSEKQFIKYGTPFTLHRVSIIFKWWLIKSQLKSFSDGCMKLENSCGFHLAIYHHIFGRYLHPPLGNTSKGGVSFLKWRQFIGYKVMEILTPKICCLSPSVKGGEQGIDAAIRTVFLGDSGEWDGTTKGSLWEVRGSVESRECIALDSRWLAAKPVETSGVDHKWQAY